MKRRGIGRVIGCVACTVTTILTLEAGNTVQPLLKASVNMSEAKEYQIDVSSRNVTTDNGTIAFTVQFDHDIGIGRQYQAETLFTVSIPSVGKSELALKGTPGKKRRELVLNWHSRFPDGVEIDWRDRSYFSFFRKNTPYRFSYSWNRDQGTFESCLNGYPMGKTTRPRDPGMVWQEKLPIDKLLFSQGPYTLVSVDCSPDVAASGKVKPVAEIGQDHTGAELRVEAGSPVYRCAFSDENDVQGWVMEGPGQLVFKDGWMEMHSPRERTPKNKGNHTFWCPFELPENYRVDWDFKTSNGEGLCILFIDGKGLDGEDVMDSSLAERNGDFKQYWKGDIRNYHFSYYDGGEWVRANKNPNKCMFAIGRRPLYEVGKAYRVTLVKQGKVIQLAINGQLVLKIEDDEDRFGPNWHGGKLALRQMFPGKTAYRNLVVSELPAQKRSK